MKKPVPVFNSLIMLLAIAVIWLSVYTVPQTAPETHGGKAAIGGAFTLTDQHGKMVRDSDFRGRVMLVFFGFTHCPDICPISTSNLSQMMELLGDKADQAAALFITVDPVRDTPAVLKSYLANFDRRIVGLTGSAEQIKKVADAYKTYYSAPPTAHERGHGDDHDDAYTVDHSGFIYLMGKDGKYVSHFAYNASPKEMAEAVRAQLK